jgi:hypothetical protein
MLDNCNTTSILWNGLICNFAKCQVCAEIRPLEAHFDSAIDKRSIHPA